MSARQPLHAAALDEVNEALDHLVSEAHAQGWSAASRRHPETDIPDLVDERRAAVIAAIRNLLPA
jgi:hypothetical protein